MKLTKAERETIVNFNEGSDEADIFTYRRDWQRKLESMGFRPNLVNDHGGKGYPVPKSLVDKPPRKPKRLSDVQKQNLHQRLNRKPILEKK